MNRSNNTSNDDHGHNHGPVTSSSTTTSDSTDGPSLHNHQKSLLIKCTYCPKSFPSFPETHEHELECSKRDLRHDAGVHSITGEMIDSNDEDTDQDHRSTSPCSPSSEADDRDHMLEEEEKSPKPNQQSPKTYSMVRIQRIQTQESSINSSPKGIQLSPQITQISSQFPQMRFKVGSTNNGVISSKKLLPGENASGNKIIPLFACRPCGTYYTSAKSLTRHRLQAHRIDPESHVHLQAFTGGNNNSDVDNTPQTPVKNSPATHQRTSDRPKRSPTKKLYENVADTNISPPRRRPASVPSKGAKVQATKSRARARSTSNDKSGKKPVIHCRFCRRGFVRRYMLQLHEKEHTEDFKYKCPHCSKGCVSSGRLTAHVKNSKPCREAQFVIQNKNNPSASPSSSVLSSSAIVAHSESLWKRTKERRRIDPDPEPGPDQGDDEDPCGDHEEETEIDVNCSLTGVPPTLKPQVEIEVREYRDGRRNYCCNYCRRIFGDRLQAQKHVRSHPDHNPFQCGGCPATYPNEDGLDWHIRSCSGDSWGQSSSMPSTSWQVQETYRNTSAKRVFPPALKSATKISRAATPTREYEYQYQDQDQGESQNENRLENGMGLDVNPPPVKMPPKRSRNRNRSRNWNRSRKRRNRPTLKGVFNCPHCDVQYRSEVWLLRHLVSCPIFLAKKKEAEGNNHSRGHEEGDEDEAELEEEEMDESMDETETEQAISSKRVRGELMISSRRTPEDYGMGIGIHVQPISDPLSVSDHESDVENDMQAALNDVDIVDVPNGHGHGHGHGNNSLDGDGDSIIVLSSGEEDDHVDCRIPREPTCFIYTHGKEASFWDSVLNDPSKRAMIPPVSAFNMAPLANTWDSLVKIGMRMELRNPLFKTTRNGKEGRDTAWLGTIEDIRGYRALVNLEIFKPRENSNQHKLWVSLLDTDVMQLRTCDRLQMPLDSEPFLKTKAAARVTDTQYFNFYRSPSVPDMGSHVEQSLDKVYYIWKLNDNCEALDIQYPHQNRLAYIKEIKGNRILVNYYVKPTSNSNFSYEATDGYDEGFWCDFNSEHIHKLGWSRKVGMDLNGGEFKFTADPNVALSILQCPPNLDIHIQEGMLLEVRHPRQTYRLVGAIVIRVLTSGYFMVETRERELAYKPTRTRFVFHITSPFIFQRGFGMGHGLHVDFDEDEEQEASGLNVYLKIDHLPPRPRHNFVVGHRLEAPMICKPELIHPATVKTVAGHLLRLHFDGKNPMHNENYQWVDAHSSEIYPAGYSESFGFQLQGNVRVLFHLHPSVFPGKSNRLFPRPLEFSFQEYFNEN